MGQVLDCERHHDGGERDQPEDRAQWQRRTSVADQPAGPRAPHSTVLSGEEEAPVVAFRRHTLLPLDDCL
jgi:hypothetical protein